MKILKNKELKRRIRRRIRIGRIGSRLALSFAIIVLLTFLGSLVSLWQFNQMRQQAQHLNQVNAEAIAILRVNNDVLKLKSELQRLAETEDITRFTVEALKRRSELAADIERAIEVLESSANKGESRYVIQLKQLRDINNLSTQIDLMIERAQAGDWPAVRFRLENQAEQVSQLTQNLVEEIDTVVTNERLAVLARTEQAQQQAFGAMLTVGLLAVVVAVILGVLVTRSIAEPLARLNMGAKALARREFHHQVEVTGRDELANLTHAFNDAASQLAKLYGDLEALVEDRTNELHRRVMQLETSLAVGHRVASILDLDKLLAEVVELIKERAGYYFVGVFLLDETKEYMVARAGTGQAGLMLRQQGFRLKVGQEGVVGWVAAHRRSLRVDDVYEDSLYRPVEVIPDTRSELALPLIMSKNILGVLDIHSDQPTAFRLDDEPILQSLADQVAVAIQNASLYQSERARRELTEALYNAGRAISSTLELPEVLELILEHLAKIVPYNRAAVMLQRHSELEIVAARGFPAETPAVGLRIQVKENDVFHQISQSQQPLVVADISERQDWHHLAGLPSARVWLGVPLIRLELVIGVLSLTRERPESYLEEEVALASTFASQAAIALENARFYDKIIRFTQQLEDMVRERTEAVQAAYAQLEHLDQTKSDFINMAAHELRTPLTLLRGYSQMLLKEATIRDHAFYFDLVSGIHSGSVRLHEIVNSMLDITKIDARTLKLYPEPVSIPSLIQLVVEEFEEALAERTQVLTMADMTTLPLIEADPDALHKVFYHLIGNAIKYTPDGGKITVSGQAVVAGSQPDFAQPGVELVVSDTGIGIDPEFHQLIFTKFYQTGELALHSSGKTKFKGSGPGLGLAIVQGIVEAHRGKVWVESEGYNEKILPGSRFHVLLPLRQGKKS